MDKQLANLAADQHCFYTRYADDLSISTNRHTFPSELAEVAGAETTVGQALESTIQTNGFTLNHKKTRLMGRSSRQRVTGLVVNEKVNLPKDYVRGLRALLHVWRAYGREAALASLMRAEPLVNRPPGKPPARFEDIVRGRVQYVGKIKGWDHRTYLHLSHALSLLLPAFSPTEPPLAFRDGVRVYTEGPTDQRHLRAAQVYFKQRGEFTGFTLEPVENPPYEGEDGLMKAYRTLALQPPQTPTLCLFDGDSSAAHHIVGKTGWRHSGAGLAILVLAPPSWMKKRSEVCIELLHPDAVRHTKNPYGQRIFLRSEFDKKGHHLTESCHLRKVGQTGLVVEKVFDDATRQQIARKKTDFAHAIELDQAQFPQLDFEGFRPTFERIEKALSAIRKATRH